MQENKLPMNTVPGDSDFSEEPVKVLPQLVWGANCVKTMFFFPLYILHFICNSISDLYTSSVFKISSLFINTKFVFINSLCVYKCTALFINSKFIFINLSLYL